MVCSQVAADETEIAADLEENLAGTDNEASKVELFDLANFSYDSRLHISRNQKFWEISFSVFKHRFSCLSQRNAFEFIPDTSGTQVYRNFYV